MEKWIFTVRANCTDDSREDEFNEWYDNVHVADVMGTEGFVKAERYCSPEWSAYGQGRYLAIYEIETDNINKTMETLFERMREECFKKGRWSELIRPISFGLFKPVSSFSK
jgi:hypothetical protein